jgi:hypothetical protein
MRATFTILAAATLLWSVTSTVLADEAQAREQSAEPKAVAKVVVPATHELRTKMYRAMAELIEAQSASEPNEAKIAELTKEVQTLRQQIRGSVANRSVAPASAPGSVPGWSCPWGGPGLGPGGGYGAGPAWGRGGRGSGYGRGQGYGPGFGWGGGRGPRAGRGAGMGPGFGNGPGYVDADHDGTCDNFERRWGVSH